MEFWLARERNRLALAVDRILANEPDHKSALIDLYDEGIVTKADVIKRLKIDAATFQMFAMETRLARRAGLTPLADAIEQEAGDATIIRAEQQEE